MNLAIILEIFRAEMSIERLRLIGEMAQGETVRQMLADSFGVEVALMDKLEETTSMEATRSVADTSMLVCRSLCNICANSTVSYGWMWPGEPLESLDLSVLPEPGRELIPPCQGTRG